MTAAGVPLKVTPFAPPVTTLGVPGDWARAKPEVIKPDAMTASFKQRTVFCMTILALVPSPGSA
ncbi:MAG: hypothetical protein ACOY91_04890 [Pseudomonadota bacterium]